MKQNIGQTDKIIRIAIGIIVILSGIIMQSWWGAVGIIPLVTSLIGFCPLYPLLKISTCEKSGRTEKPAKSSSFKS
jgi:hypothetical protein